MSSLYSKVVEWLHESNPKNQLIKPVRLVSSGGASRPVLRFENAMSWLNRISLVLISLTAALIGLCLLVAFVLGLYLLY